MRSLLFLLLLLSALTLSQAYDASNEYDSAITDSASNWMPATGSTGSPPPPPSIQRITRGDFEQPEVAHSKQTTIESRQQIENAHARSNNNRNSNENDTNELEFISTDSEPKLKSKGDKQVRKKKEKEKEEEEEANDLASRLKSIEVEKENTVKLNFDLSKRPKKHSEHVNHQQKWLSKGLHACNSGFKPITLKLNSQRHVAEENENMIKSNSELNINNVELESTAAELDFDTANAMQLSEWEGQQQEEHPIRHSFLRQQFSAPLLQPQQPVRQQKSLHYSAPIVMYGQSIVQKVDLAAPQVQKQHLTAQAIVQPSFQTAPVMHLAAISTTAPTMRKGFGSSIELGAFQQQTDWNQQQPNVGLDSSDSGDSAEGDSTFSASSSQQPLWRHRRRHRDCGRNFRRLALTPQDRRRLLTHPLRNHLTFPTVDSVCVPHRHLAEIKDFLSRVEDQPLVVIKHERETEIERQRQEELRKKQQEEGNKKKNKDDEGWFKSPFPVFRPKKKPEDESAATMSETPLVIYSYYLESADDDDQQY